jgi:hypothetical protein
VPALKSSTYIGEESSISSAVLRQTKGFGVLVPVVNPDSDVFLQCRNAFAVFGTGEELAPKLERCTVADCGDEGFAGPSIETPWTHV